VISSKSEGLPLSLLEALAAGLPIAATAVGAIPDVISKSQCGSLCPPSNSGELAACMEREMQRAASGGVAERARTFAASEYGLERMTRAYGRLYEEIAGTKSARAALMSS
jgi:glycosyltransferase involved in cell wall biosynthesis